VLPCGLCDWNINPVGAGLSLSLSARLDIARA